MSDSLLVIGQSQRRIRTAMSIIHGIVLRVLAAAALISQEIRGQGGVQLRGF